MNLSAELRGAIYFDWVEDNLGSVWITTNLGVLKIVKTDLDKFLNGQITAVKFKLLDNHDGMKSKECTAATHALVSSTGKIWVPTISGISIFYPEKIKENTVPPPVFITALKADNKETDGSQPYVIEPGKLRYTFDYTATSFIVPGKIQFKYKLDNVDAFWINAGTVREAEYTNLAPGDYIFRVIASNNDGVWNEKGAIVKFTVKPFFYQTLVFKLVLVFAVLILFYSIYKWRVN